MTQEPLAIETPTEVVRPKRQRATATPEPVFDNVPGNQPVPTTEAKEVKAIKKWGQDIVTKDTGLAALSTLDEQIKYASLLIEKKMISATFKTPAEVVVGIQYAKALNMEPVVALRMMYVVNGRPTLYGDGPLSLCQRGGKLASIEEFFLDEAGKRISVENGNVRAEVWAAVTRVWRKGDDRVQEDIFSLMDLQKAGLEGSNPVYKKYRRIMIRYKARTMALKVKFADLLNGMEIAEYGYNFTPDLPEDQQPPQTLEATKRSAEQLNGFIEAHATKQEVTQ